MLSFILSRPGPRIVLGLALSVTLGACDTSSADDGLPPDPGEQGTLTLEGIDSDGDGVRDDVQRAIYQEFAEPEVHDALMSFARVAQTALLDAAAGEDARDAVVQMAEATECLIAADEANAGAALLTIEAALANTAQRSQAYLDFNAQLSGTLQEVESPGPCGTTPEASAREGGSDSRAVVVFSNGMFTSWAAARTNSRVLVNVLRRQGGVPDGMDVTPFFAYNQDERGRSLFEVLAQSSGATYGAVLDAFSRGDDMPEWLRRWLEEQVVQIDEAEYVLDDDLRSQVQAYRTLLDSGRKVVVVAHSQGNFYANRACRLIDSPSLGVVAVGTPADRVCSGYSPYTTNRNDLVIAGFVRGANWTVLPPNTDDALGGTALGHDFLDDYLFGGNSGPRIIGHVRDMLETLPQPAVTVGTGPVMVTLEWGAEPDVDLHVFEPGGDHVYFADRTGASGTLDRDDVTGYGPENYFVPVSTLQVGTYWIGVDYFSGRGPETARVQVTTAGTTYPSFTRYLASPGQGGSPTNPVPVAEIEVAQQGGQFVYRVREVQNGPPTRRPSSETPLVKRPPLSVLP